MTTITAGSVATVYCPLASDITITPGTSGRVSLQGRSQTGGQSLAPREIYTATTVSAQAGDVLTLEAINVDATYTAPAGLDTALQSLVSEAGNITTAALATTTGTLGQTVRLSDGDNKGAVLMWSTPAGSSTPAWCWWLWPQSPYEA